MYTLKYEEKKMIINYGQRSFGYSLDIYNGTGHVKRDVSASRKFFFYSREHESKHSA
jgi:hypothetical protein